MGTAPLAEAIRAADDSGRVLRAVLRGVATWASAVTAGDARSVVLVAGVDAPPAAHVVDADAALVVAVGPDVALVAVADGQEPLATWACGGAAVQDLLARLVIPPGSVALVEQAVGAAPVTGGRASGALLEAMDAVLAHERASLAARLHDGPVQDLTAAQLLLDSALWAGDIPPEVRGTLDQGLDALRSAITAARGLMGDLAPRRSADGGP